MFVNNKALILLGCMLRSKSFNTRSVHDVKVTIKNNNI